MEPVVVFLCRCAGNIGGVVDLEQVAEVLGHLPAVAAVETHELLCAPDGQEFFSQAMARHGGRAVVGACSVREHEATFQRCLTQGGVNRFLLAMANLREHCSWVTEDRGAATTKAQALLRAAVARVQRLEPLEDREITCSSDVVIIGGGIAGVEAALLAAQADRQVTLVENSPSLGGRAARIEDLAPQLECAPCLLAPRLAAVMEHEKIRVLTDTEVTNVVGFVGNFTVTLQRRARWVDQDKCLGLGCDECLEACPVSVPNEYEEGMGQRQAIYVPFGGAQPNACVIDRQNCQRGQGEDCQLCREACPMEAVDFDQSDESTEVTAGAIVVATGLAAAQSEAGAALGHGAPGEVYSWTEFERLLASDGPTEGKVVMRNGEAPRHIGVVHCVGRTDLGYCSGLCCSAGLKIGLLANRGEASIRVSHFHQGLMLRGPEDEALAQRAQAHGLASLVQVPAVDQLRVEAGAEQVVLQWHDAAGAAQQQELDMVVLLTGVVPRQNSAALFELLGLTATEAGFAAPDHNFLRALQSNVEGVYVAGGVTGPRRVVESVAQGQGAVGMALARLTPGRKLAVESVTAQVDETVCSGCLTCVAVCPYQANQKEPDSGHAQTNEVLCKGCGVCVATCPSGAATARHFTEAQLQAEIAEVLRDA